MSGHNKWSQIKRQKGVADAKRSQVFSKIVKLLSVAARQGGGDPTMNPRLRLLIEQARAANMPKENIDRAITRGLGQNGETHIEEALFEVYGPGGVGILVEAATENINRTTAELKAVLNKNDGKLAASGAVSYQCIQRGSLLIPLDKQTKSRDELELASIEAGATDYEDQGDVLVVYTDPKALMTVKQQLEEQEILTEDPKTIWQPRQFVAVTDSTLARQIVRLVDNLEDLDDVTAVTTNADIAEEILTELV